MEALPQELRYTETHEWVRLKGNIATIGITDFAQEQLSDITYVELPDPGTVFAAGDEAAVVESVKAASDIYAPLGGEVVDVNSDLEETPELINNDPFNDGWLFKLKVEDPSEFEDLLSADTYSTLLPEEE